MIHATALPVWLAVLIAIMIVLGAGLTLIGSIGLLRLKTFYERVHPATMGTTLGVRLTLIASMIMFSALESRPVLHELVIIVFVVATTPITYMLLVRAAIHRDRAEESGTDDETRAARGH